MIETPVLEDPDDAYANAPYISGGDTFPARWLRTASNYRDSMRAAGRLQEDVAYGAAPRERADVFRPTGTPRGVALVVHGGYWLRFDRTHFSRLARGAVERGWIVVMPSYPLCPDATIGAIGVSIEACALFATTIAPGPLRLAGHSAGGQLVSRILCAQASLDQRVRTRIDRVLSISGVHDLFPLLGTSMNSTLGLVETDAIAWSPARSTPHPEFHQRLRTIAWAGADERPEFVRQNALLETAWAGAGFDVTTHVEPGRHHFDVIEDLEDPASAMLEHWLGASAIEGVGARP